MQTAVVLDSANKAVLIETQDETFVGHTVKVIVDVDQTEIADAGSLEIEITFEGDPPAFDMNGLQVDQLECGEEDEDWSLVLPPLVNENASDVTIEMN